MAATRGSERLHRQRERGERERERGEWERDRKREGQTEPPESTHLRGKPPCVVVLLVQADHQLHVLLFRLRSGGGEGWGAFLQWWRVEGDEECV